MTGFISGRPIPSRAWKSAPASARRLIAASSPFLAGALLLLSGCAAPRSVHHPASVLDKGEWAFGLDVAGNLATAPASKLYGGLENAVRSAISKDSIVLDEELERSLEALVAYSIDPVTMTMAPFVRYGLGYRSDIGYSYAGGAHEFQGTIQFLRSEAMNGSTGVRFSMQSYELPSFLGKLQDALGYGMKRKDLLFPVIFGQELGQDGRLGSYAFGAAYGLTFIDYLFEPTMLYRAVSSEYQRIEEVPQSSETFSTYGAFANLHIGWKPVYLVPSLSVFWQDYGTYKLFEDQEVSLKGWTFVPSIALSLKF